MPTRRPSVKKVVESPAEHGRSTRGRGEARTLPRAARRNAPRELNRFLGGALQSENSTVRQLAKAFNTKDPHSRRALLKWAAIFAGVSLDEAYLLGRPLGEYIVLESALGARARRRMELWMRRWSREYNAKQRRLTTVRDRRGRVARRRAVPRNGGA
jgi:hypothetical protein